MPNQYQTPQNSTPSNDQLEAIILQNQSGLSCQLLKTPAGWGLGSLALHGQVVEQPLMHGLLFVINPATGEKRWLAGTTAEQIDARTVRCAGQADVDGVLFTFEIAIQLDNTRAAMRMTPVWSVDTDLDGWEVGLAYHDAFTHDWHVQSYPWAGNSDAVTISPLRYCGVPGVLVYRSDLSMVVLFAIDSHADYLNPTTWSGDVEFLFANRQSAPQFRIGHGKLTAGIRYEFPLQLILSDAGDFVDAVMDIVPAWIAVNDYKVDTSLMVRPPQEAFEIVLDGRRQMESWKPGIGYEHHRGTPFVYVGNNPYIAFFEYRLHELTGEPVWRERAFEQIDFALQGQQPDGVLHTSWYFQPSVRPGNVVAEGFCSWDWLHNGYKVDINVWMARYILQTWQRVKDHEGLDRQDWYRAAIGALDWALRQQNPDGGLPQCVDIATGQRSSSVVSGRALVALPIIAGITGDARYLQVSAELEQYLRRQVEGRFCYTGMHPDLPPEDYEQDSIYAVVEYWLDKHARTGEADCLRHAVANAYFGLLYWCPKQLSWVQSPTQCAHSEQQHFNQYSVYCYGNRKIQCLDRLYRLTGDPLFDQLTQRVMQLNFYVQVVDGPYKGAMTEAIADPWQERGQGFEWRGSPYTSELVTDLMLQLIEMGLVTKP